jgi:hypothetical protein
MLERGLISKRKRRWISEVGRELDTECTKGTGTESDNVYTVLNIKVQCAEMDWISTVHCAAMKLDID